VIIQILSAERTQIVVHTGTVLLCNTYTVGIARFTGTGHSAKPAQYTKEPSPCVLRPMPTFSVASCRGGGPTPSFKPHAG
jgi:hypothetical protein